MSVPRVVLDTNVLVAALRSRLGASYRVLSVIDAGFFETGISVPLVLEYEDVLKRHARELDHIEDGDIDDLLDYICRVAHRQQVFYLWRPVLRDPGDDMVLEAAVAAGCHAIVTHNSRDFRGVEQFGVHVWSPSAFLSYLEDEDEHA